MDQIWDGSFNGKSSVDGTATELELCRNRQSPVVIVSIVLTSMIVPDTPQDLEHFRVEQVQITATVQQNLNSLLLFGTEPE